METFLLFLLVGKLLIYLGMKFPLLSESRFEFVKRLWECDECSGVWVYTLLSFVMGEVLFVEYFYFPVVSELITGGISSIIVHLISIGWREKFTVVEL